MAPTPPALPHTFRPRWGRRVPYALAVVVLAVFVLLVAGLSDWPVLDRSLVALVGAFIVWFLHRLADVRVVADEHGLTVANILGRRSLDWAEVVGVTLRPADPWLVLDVADGTTVSAMGVQGSDGAYAVRQAAQLELLVAERSGTEGR
ncbi:PH domain-containing protein [Motilibacter deserti]|uniref:PH domain-containing protein n=1 Tax=Motilibacter deserti TaxID=2714956 RepID=A0ABX0GW71_9ACTN|nr:PH domain-containing protein [Motilibacter deserti]